MNARCSLRTWLSAGLLLLATNAAAGSLADPFPRPEGLAPDIHFWTRVYTEIDTNHGFVHDDRKLGVVYTTLEFSPESSKRQRRKVIKKVKQRYRKILLKLASGKRSGLSQAERDVLALWPEKVSNRELKAAAYRLRFQLGQSDRFRAGVIRSGAWDAYIRQTLKDEGLPEGLAALPHVESSFNPKARSHRGAAGLWQFTRSTGRRYMRIDRAVDERMDPQTATVAAARLLKHNHGSTGTWPLAITSYNHGSAGMRRAKRKLGTSDIEAIVRNYQSRRFGFASRNFYVAFLAALDVSEDAERYFGRLERDQPAEFEVYYLDDYLSASTVIASLEIDARVLREYNPALRKTVWQNRLRIPRGYALRVPPRPGIDSGQLLAGIAVDERHQLQKREREYVVESGNTLSTIAMQFGVSTYELMEINNLRSADFIRVGQVLHLPGDARQAPAPKRYAAREPMPGDGLYSVERGDTVSLIALRFGTTETELFTLNGLKPREFIYPGQTLIVSAQTQPAPTPVDVIDVVALAAEEQGRRELEEQSIDQVESGEPASQDEAVALGPAQPPAAHPQLSADPSDYAVADDGTIEVQIPETIGHYADWLGVSSQHLRDLNGLSFHAPVIMGHRFKLDFSNVSPEAFESSRRAFHLALQESFFGAYQITGTQRHTIESGDSLWLLAHYTYSVPIWLIRQYNPDLDFLSVRPGAAVVIPIVEQRDEPQDPAPGNSVVAG